MNSVGMGIYLTFTSPNATVQADASL